MGIEGFHGFLRQVAFGGASDTAREIRLGQNLANAAAADGVRIAMGTVRESCGHRVIWTASLVSNVGTASSTWLGGLIHSLDATRAQCFPVQGAVSK